MSNAFAAALNHIELRVSPGRTQCGIMHWHRRLSFVVNFEFAVKFLKLLGHCLQIRCIFELTELLL